MQYPELRMRRLRATHKLRDMVRETSLSVNDFIYPLFVKEGIEEPEEIASMPGQYPLKNIVEAAKETQALGIPAVMIFGIPELKDEKATSALDENGITQKAIRAIKEALEDSLMVIGDVCLCEYMSHGHCGIVENDQILNDITLELYGEVAVTYAKAGADMDMLDMGGAKLIERWQK